MDAGVSTWALTALLRSRCAGLALVCVLALVVSGCSSDESVAPPDPPSASASGRAVAAQRTLSDLVAALESGEPERATHLAVPDAAPVVEAAVANAAALALDDLSLRLVDDQGALSAEDRERFGATAWAASVEVTYRLAEWDAQPVRLESRIVFAESGGRDLVAGLGGDDDRTPLWLTGPVHPLASGRVLVIAHGDDGQRYLELGRQALTDVAKVLPGWRGSLVLEVPGSEEQLHQALAAPEGRYANIAAVTTTVDGSLVPGSPVHVFVNPQVFAELGPRGAQVVVSHETTHVATEAAFAELPTWLLEGFADYVALANSGIPVRTAAAQILDRISKQGPPDHLPTAEELDPTATGLGATYEEAWLAARFIAQEHGERDLVAFYRRVSEGLGVAEAFRKVLGTSEAAFVERWRAHLRDLAGGVAG